MKHFCQKAKKYVFGQSPYTYITDSSYRFFLDPTLKSELI